MSRTTFPQSLDEVFDALARLDPDDPEVDRVCMAVRAPVDDNHFAGLSREEIATRMLRAAGTDTWELLDEALRSTMSDPELECRKRSWLVMAWLVRSYDARGGAQIDFPCQLGAELATRALREMPPAGPEPPRAGRPRRAGRGGGARRGSAGTWPSCTGRPATPSAPSSAGSRATWPGVSCARCRCPARRRRGRD